MFQDAVVKAQAVLRGGWVNTPANEDLVLSPIRAQTSTPVPNEVQDLLSVEATHTPRSPRARPDPMTLPPKKRQTCRDNQAPLLARKRLLYVSIKLILGGSLNLTFNIIKLPTLASYNNIFCWCHLN